MRTLITNAFALSVLSLSSIVATSVGAQSITTNEDELIDEIIVTATRRPVSLQKLAASVGVLSGAMLESAGLFAVEDFWRMVPSMSYFDKGFGGKRVTIRGVNDSAINGTGAPIIATYLDDTPLIAQAALFQQPPNFKAVDVERIEVLRGPQGTLFGAGSMGGAIRTITRKADPSGFSQAYDAWVSDTAHGGTNFGATAAVNAPIADDRSALRFTAWLMDDGGFIDDISLGIRNKNRNKTTGLRIGATWRTAEGLSVEGKLQYQDAKAQGFAWEDPVGKPAIGVATTGDLQSALLVDDFRDEETMLASLNVDYKFRFGTLTSATSWFETDTDLLIDWANEGFFVFGVYLPFNIPVSQTQRMFAQEFRLAAADDSKVDWLVGAFYLDDSRDGSNRINAPEFNGICGGCSTQPDGEEFLFGFTETTKRKETGLFADLMLSLSDKIEFNLGLRRYDLEIGSDITAFGGLVGDPPPMRDVDEFKFDGYTGKASMSYKATEGVMIYALASNGFREGGTNGAFLAQVCSVEEIYKPDELWNYEVGVRSQWLDRRLTLNATLYYVNWSDAQLKVVTDGCPGNAIVNSEGITSRGAEIEFSYTGGSNWEVSGGLGLTDSTLDKDVPLLNAPAGRDVPYTPDVTTNLATTIYPGTLWNMDTSVRIDIQHVGDSYSEITEFAGVLPIVKQPSYTLVNLRVGFTTGRWHWSVFADNLFDEKATIACCGVVGEIITNRPRAIGLRATYRH